MTFGQNPKEQQLFFVKPSLSCTQVADKIVRQGQQTQNLNPHKFIAQLDNLHIDHYVGPPRE